MEAAFARSTKQVLAHFKVDENTGLTNNQIDELRKKHGRNCTFAQKSFHCPSKDPTSM